MNGEASPRRIMDVTPAGQRKTGRPKARWKIGWKGCENGTNKKLVVYSYECIGTEATFKEGQGLYRVVEPVMIMMIKPHILRCFVKDHKIVMGIPEEDRKTRRQLTISLKCGQLLVKTEGHTGQLIELSWSRNFLLCQRLWISITVFTKPLHWISYWLNSVHFIPLYHLIDA
jgi:hypothetical protein